MPTISAYTSDDLKRRIDRIIREEGRKQAQVGSTALELYARLPAAARRAFLEVFAAESEQPTGVMERALSEVSRALLNAKWEITTERIREAAGGRVDAFIDTFGHGYVALAIELGVRPERIDTIIDFDAAHHYGVKTDGNAAGASMEVLAQLADLVDRGVIEIPIARVYPLEEVREAYRELEQRHTRGKIVLRPHRG